MAELLTDAEEAEVERARRENGNRSKESRNAHQKRFDRLTGEKYRLRQENEVLQNENRELQHANQLLRTGLERALILIDRLRGRKNVR
jgi:predicted RNase H-like nuclease (RuvC/YqgF family)